MPCEGQFGICYDMDFLPHVFFYPIYCHSSPFRPFSYSRTNLLPLAVFNTELAYFLIIFSSLCWHWFMRVMLDAPPWPVLQPTRTIFLSSIPLPHGSIALSFLHLLMILLLYFPLIFCPHLCLVSSSLFILTTLWLSWMANGLPSWWLISLHTWTQIISLSYVV